MRRVDQSRAKFLDQARLAEARFADNLHELALALPRALPAPQQHRDFLLAPDQRRQRALPGAPPAAARAHDAVEHRRLRHALQRLRAAILGDEQPRDLPPDSCRGPDRSGLRRRLHAGGDIGRVAEHLTLGIDHYRAGLYADARLELRPPGARISGVDLGERALDFERGAQSPLGVVLLRERIAEQGHDTIAQFLRDTPAHPCHRRRGGVDVAADEIPPILGVEFRGDAGRADEIAEHHGEVAALGGFYGRRGRLRVGRDEGRRRGRVRDGFQEPSSMPEQNAELFEIGVAEVGQDIGIDAVVAERRLVLPEPEAPQPLSDVHGHVSRWRGHDRPG